MSANTSEQLLYQLKSRGALTAADAASILDMTAAGASQQFARLAGAGLVEAEDRKAGRGRPRRFWRLTEKGHARFPDRHFDLTLEFIDATREVFGEDGLEQLIRHREAASLAAYRTHLAGRTGITARLEALAGIRTREGYMAEWREDGTGAFLLVENHCPVCAAARACQGLCRSELDVFRALLEPDADVERVEHVLAGARRCAYRVTPRDSPGRRKLEPDQ